jgi:hypothetical protein
MPSRTKAWLVFGCTFCLLSMLLLASAGSASAAATVRFVHAVPGGGPAALSVTVGVTGVSSSPASFGKAAGPLETRAGTGKLVLTSIEGSRVLARATQALEDGKRYTVVAMPKSSGSGAQLRIWEDGTPKPGEAELRAIHAAPELGSPDVRVGSRLVAEKLAYGQATGYVGIPPGTYDVYVTRPGGSGGALAMKRGVALTAGTATTAIVIGSSGAPTSILTLNDGTAAPAGAPATGYGGLASGGGGPSRLLVALLAGLLAAALGAAAWTIVARR